MAVGWEEIAYNAGIAFVVCVVCLAIFGFVRRSKAVGTLYTAKRHLKIPFRFRPPKLLDSLLTWVKPVFMMSDEKFASCAGFDALAYVRFLSLGARICAIWSFFSLAIALPTNWTSNNVDEVKQLQQSPTCTGANPPAECSYSVTEFDETSLTNVPNDTHRYWAHTIVIMLTAFLLLKMLWHHWKVSLKWRLIYYARTRKGEAAHTVLVTDIPGTPQGTILGRIADNTTGLLYKVLPGGVKKKVQGILSGTGTTATSSLKKMDPTAKHNPLFSDPHYEVYKHNVEAPAGTQVTVNSAYDPGVGMQQVPMAVGSEPPQRTSAVEHPPPAHVDARLSLDNFESRPAPTDFESWEQAEAAIAANHSVHDIVAREFARDFGPDEVRHVKVVKNESKVSGVVDDYKKKREALEDLADSWISSLKKDKQPKRKQVTVKAKKGDERAVKRWGAGKSKQDVMEYKLWELEEAYREAKEEGRRAEGMESSAAFVTLRSRLTQSVASSGMLSYNEDLWKTQPAPAPSDLIWRHIAFRNWERSLRGWLEWGAFVGLLFIYMPIVLAVQSVINLNAYREDVPVIGDILDLPVIGGIIQGVLPTLAFTIFLAILPMILTAMANHIGGKHARSAIEFDVCFKYFLFMFIIVFLFQTLTGAAASSGGGSNPFKELVTEILAKGVGDSFRWLGASIPQQSSFFLLFILTKGILAQSIKFLKIPKAAIFFIMSKIKGSERQKKKLYSQQYASYGAPCAMHSIMLLLVFIFGIVQPLICLAGLAYFLLQYFFARYDLLYIMREPYQTGGAFWPVLFRQLYFGFYLSVITNLVLLLIKAFWWGPILLGIVLGIATLFWFKVQSTFNRPMTMSSIHAAADFDRADTKFDWLKDVTPEEEALMKSNEWDLEDTSLGPVEERYAQPALHLSDEKHQHALRMGREADRLASAHAAGGKVSDEPLMQPRKGDNPDNIRV